MPRAHSTATPPRRTRARKPKISSVEALYERPPIVSGEEKRELILAHAAQQVPLDRTRTMTLWAGVAASFVFVLLGWWWARAQVPALSASTKHDADLIMMTDQAQRLSEHVKREVQAISTRLDTLDKGVNQEHRVLDRMADLIEATSTASPFIAPTFTTSSTSSTIPPTTTGSTITIDSP